MFRGNYWNLAERYTDMVKTVRSYHSLATGVFFFCSSQYSLSCTSIISKVFVGMFYSAITPTGLIITVVAMTVSTSWVPVHAHDATVPISTGVHNNIKCSLPKQIKVTYYSDKYSLLRLWSRPPA